MPKFTPGPWRVEAEPGWPNRYSIWDSDRNPHADAGNGATMAANAALMSAAPDLHAALVEARQIIRVFHGDAAWDIYDRCAPEMNRINAALAKAEGKS